MKRLFLLKISGLKDGGSFWGNVALEAESMEDAFGIVRGRFGGTTCIAEIALAPGELLEFTIERR